MVRVIDSVTAIRKAPAPGDGCPFLAQTASSRRCSDSVSNVMVEQTKRDAVQTSLVTHMRSRLPSRLDWKADSETGRWECTNR
jgi:hypothetical protein